MRVRFLPPLSNPRRLVLTTIILPLPAAVSCGLFGRRIGRQGAVFLSVACSFVTFSTALVLFISVALVGDVIQFSVSPRIDTGVLAVHWALLYDPLTATMLVVVTFVSLLVQVYSADYMAEDPHTIRFYVYLSLPTFFMLVLVTSSNLPQLFLGWEGVGLCSYLLISFWYSRLAANKAAVKALAVNRIGDCGLPLAMGLLSATIGSLEFTTIFALAPHTAGTTLSFLGYRVDVATFAGAALLLGAIGKSAQLGLHTWLPDAMEGPTPVSALIHAATMVTAGVFSLTRCSPLLEYAPDVPFVTAPAGAVTALCASTIGLVQHDIKKIIAYSTCSQLGYMVLARGMSNYILGLFHLATHACFKALLFLGAGAVIHALADEQDLRRLGGLGRLLPLTYGGMLVGPLALMGFPFLAGHYSKDAILELAATYTGPLGSFLHLATALATVMTVIYSSRLLHRTFLGVPNGFRVSYVTCHEAPYHITISPVVLVVASLSVGYLGRDIFAGPATQFFGSAISTLPFHVTNLDAEFLSGPAKYYPLILGAAGAPVTLATFSLLGGETFRLKRFWHRIYGFASSRWYFDRVFNKTLALPALLAGYWCTFVQLDKGFSEFFGPSGLLYGLRDVSRMTAALHTRDLSQFVNIMLLVLTLLGFTFPS